MQPTGPDLAHHPDLGTGPWTRWRGYLARWLIFGVVVEVYQPVIGPQGHFWQEKLHQTGMGLLFGTLCALVFTLAENTFNVPRVQWKSYVIAVATWLLVKVSFVSTMAALG